MVAELELAPLLLLLALAIAIVGFLRLPLREKTSTPPTRQALALWFLLFASTLSVWWLFVLHHH